MPEHIIDKDETFDHIIYQVIEGQEENGILDIPNIQDIDVQADLNERQDEGISHKSVERNPIRADFLKI